MRARQRVRFDFEHNRALKSFKYRNIEPILFIQKVLLLLFSENIGRERMKAGVLEVYARDPNKQK